jgi:hypothetical protein
VEILPPHDRLIPVRHTDSDGSDVIAVRGVDGRGEQFVAELVEGAVDGR